MTSRTPTIHHYGLWWSSDTGHHGPLCPVECDVCDVRGVTCDVRRDVVMV